MKRKLLYMIAVAGLTTAASALAHGDDGSGLRVVVPMPPPTSRPSEADISLVTDAERSFDESRKNAESAHAELVQARANLDRITRNLQAQLETEVALADAIRAAATARATYDHVSRPILASLAQSADYRNACAAVAEARQASNEVCACASSPIDQRIAAAQAVLSAKSNVTQLENTALDSNAAVASARQKSIEAAQRLNELRSNLWQTIRDDPSYVAANRAVDSAREKAALADQQLADARQELFSAHRRFADKQESHQQILNWSYRHGLPDPP